MSEAKKRVSKSAPKKTGTKCKYLVIVESPAKCKKIESFLGEDYTCIASMGHLRAIDGLQSIRESAHFEIAFTILPNKRQHIETMREIISRYSYENIYLGTDDDREGMAIAWHICVLFNLPIEHTPRILFNEITKSALEAAIASPTRIDMNVVRAQNARQILDMYVGYKISPFLWKHLYSSKTAPLSAGRCQTPALRLIYDNQREITEYMKTGLHTKYKITSYFFGKNLPFELDTDIDSAVEVEEFLRKSRPFTHTLSLKEPKDSVLSPPQPFNTSRLLQTASNTLSLSPKHTMHYCQLLYQSGYITYMRTDATVYSKEYLEKARNYIAATWGAAYVGELDVLENKNAANPHEAIRATQLSVSEVNAEEPKMVALYKLIWRNSIESCMSNAVIKVIDAHISAPDDRRYTHRIEIPKFMGWKSVKTATAKQAEGEGVHLYLQSIKSPAIYNKIDATVKLSGKKPSHYTEASLIQKLEDLGIGRPSTFSYIIETIQERGYAQKMDIEGETVVCTEYSMLRGEDPVKTQQTKVFGKESGKLVIQPLGIETIEFLIKHFNPLFDYDYTRTMELQLDRIAMDETIVWHAICEECAREIRDLSKGLVVKKRIYPLEDGHELCFTKTGPVIRVANPTINDNNDNDSDADAAPKYQYKRIKKEVQLDLDKLRNNEYALADLVETSCRDLGEFEGKDVSLKNGRFGLFIEWGDRRIACKQIASIGEDANIDEISPDVVLSFLEQESGVRHAQKTNVLREIDNNLSIRKGKYGPYAFYQTPSMHKPTFYNISKFKEPFMICSAENLKEWLRKTYKANID